MSHPSLLNQTVYVGGYRMGEPPASVTWCFTRKPSAWHRWWVRFTLGWIWVDQ